MGGSRFIFEVMIDRGKAFAGLIVAAVVAVHDSPKGVFVDLELEPIVAACGVSEIPGVDRVGSFDQLGIRIPSPGMAEYVLQGVFQIGQERADPGVVAGGLPGDECAIDKPVFDVGFYGDAHVFRPVFAFTRDLFRLNGEVVENAAIAGLSVGEVSDCGGHVLLEMSGSAHDIRVVSYPNGRCVRRAVPSNGVAIDDHIHGVFFEKSLNSRCEFIEFRSSGFDVS